MKFIRTLSAAVLTLLVSACGYHLGGVKPANMKNMNTFCVEMFENQTVQPNIGMLMTTSLTNALQSDGTYRMAPRENADFIIKGIVTHIDRDSLRTNTNDSYVSSEIGLVVNVSYKLIERKSGRVLRESDTRATGSYFNQGVNTISSMDTALSYAARLAADNIAQDLTTP